MCQYCCPPSLPPSASSTSTSSYSSVTHHPLLPHSTSTFLPKSNLLITGGETEERGERREGREESGKENKLSLMLLTRCHIRSIYRQKLSFCFPDLPCVLPPLCVMQQAAESIPAMDAFKETFGKLIS